MSKEGNTTKESVIGQNLSDDILKNHEKVMVFDYVVTSQDDNCTPFVSSALHKAEIEITVLNETIESVKALKPDCDAIDYSLAASSGALCGLIDIFLVGKPGESPLGNITDKWFENRTCDFAKACGWKGNDKNPVKSAIGYLERTFKVPYDQRGCGDSGSLFIDLTPKNHHFKSICHNPTLLGLFFSILDQFTGSSHFIADGRLVELVNANDKFELRGSSIPGKLWAGFANWIGHLMSDVSGSSGGRTRGTGIPSPLWSWSNSIIAIKQKLGIPASQFDKDINDLAIQLFNEGYDARFQTAQAIPVLINELVVRLCYMVRRLVQYYEKTPKEERSFKALWAECKPFSNPTVKRMLTVAHGTFCLVDIGDATVRGFVTGGGNFNPVEFFLRVNLIGVGRFTISLYGEAKREFNLHRAEKDARQAAREKTILENYIEGLNVLRERYDDQQYLSFLDDLKDGDYKVAFEKTVSLADLRQASALRTKQDIDNYFRNVKI